MLSLLIKAALRLVEQLGANLAIVKGKSKAVEEEEEDEEAELRKLQAEMAM